MNNLNSRLLGVALLATAFSFQANAQTAQRVNLATYYRGGTPIDSVTYHYPSQNTPGMPILTIEQYPYTFYQIPRINVVGLYDSAINQTPSIYDAFPTREIQTISNGQVRKKVQDGSTTYLFDNNNNLISKEVIQVYSGNTFKEKDSFVYNNGNMTAHIVYNEDPNNPHYYIRRKITYTYVGAVLTSSVTQTCVYPALTLRNFQRVFYTYNANGTLDKEQNENYQHQSNTWLPSTEFQYTYNSNNTLAMRTVLDGTNTLKICTYSYNSNGLLIKYDVDEPGKFYYDDTLIYDQNQRLIRYISTNGYYNNLYPAIYSIVLNHQFSYNSSGLLEEYTAQKYDFNNNTWITNDDSVIHYYYEPYTPVSVANTHIEEASVSLFPNPAVNMVNITANWKEPQAFTVAIYNTSGQIIRQWAEEPVTDYKKQIPVTDLSAGTYFISIKGEGTNITKQFNVMK